MVHRVPITVAVTAGLLLTACSGASKPSTSSDTAVAPGAHTTVLLTKTGCSPTHMALPAGTTEIEVSNRGGASGTFQVLTGNHLVGQVERLPAGQATTLTLDLATGGYLTTCQVGSTSAGGSIDVGDVTGSVALGQATDLLAAVGAYRRYLEGQSGQLTPRVATLQRALAVGDRTAARSAYADVRSVYGLLAPAADNFGDADPAGFPNLDLAIDAEPAPGKAGGALRRIEAVLWGTASPSAATSAGDDLATDVARLDQRIGAMNLDAVEVTRGMSDDLAEVSEAVLATPAPRSTALDRADLQAAATGSRAALDIFLPALRRRDPVLAASVITRFGPVDAALAATSGLADGVGLPAVESREIATSLDALADAIAEAAPVLNQPVAG